MRRECPKGYQMINGNCQQAVGNTAVYGNAPTGMKMCGGTGQNAMGGCPPGLECHQGVCMLPAIIVTPQGASRRRGGRVDNQDNQLACWCVGQDTDIPNSGVCTGCGLGVNGTPCTWHSDCPNDDFGGGPRQGGLNPGQGQSWTGHKFWDGFDPGGGRGWRRGGKINRRAMGGYIDDSLGIDRRRGCGGGGSCLSHGDCPGSCVCRGGRCSSGRRGGARGRGGRAFGQGGITRRGNQIGSRHSGSCSGWCGGSFGGGCGVGCRCAGSTCVPSGGHRRTGRRGARGSGGRGWRQGGKINRRGRR